MSQPHDAARLATLGREWIAACNSHDLERVLALYDEDSEMTSDKIPAFGQSSGALVDKAVIASEAKQSIFTAERKNGLLRRKGSSQ